jgi:hypothetical protein
VLFCFVLLFCCFVWHVWLLICVAATFKFDCE